MRRLLFVKEGDAAARNGRENAFLLGSLGRHIVRFLGLEADFLVSLSSSSSLSSSVSLFVDDLDFVFARSPKVDDSPPPPPLVRDNTDFAFERFGNLLSACFIEER